MHSVILIRHIHEKFHLSIKIILFIPLKFKS